MRVAGRVSSLFVLIAEHHFMAGMPHVVLIDSQVDGIWVVATLGLS